MLKNNPTFFQIFLRFTTVLLDKENKNMIADGELTSITKN